MQARYVEMRGEKVYLQRDDGRYFEFPLADLSSTDQIYVQEQLQAAKPQPDANQWAEFHYTNKTDTGIATHIVGRYREEGKYFEIAISRMSVNIPNGLVDSHHVNMGRCYPIVIQPDNRNGHDWWRGRSIETRDSDGSLEFEDAVLIDKRYFQLTTPSDIQSFKIYISPWARKPQEDKLLLCMYMNPYYAQDRHIQYYFPLAEIKFAPEEAE